MLAPSRTPNANVDSDYLDDFAEFPREKTNGVLATRTLKPPPEIWELVHPVQEEHFKPGTNFARRLATRRLMYGLCAVVLVSFAATAVWKFRVAQKVVEVLNAPDPPRKQSTPRTSKPVVTQTTKPSPASSTSAIEPAVTQPTGASISTEVVQTASVIRRKAKRPALPQSAVAGATITSATTKTADPSAKPRETPVATREDKPQPATLSAPEKLKAEKVSSPEVITPSKTEQKPKPKVIQWP